MYSTRRKLLLITMGPPLTQRRDSSLRRGSLFADERKLKSFLWKKSCSSKVLSLNSSRRKDRKASRAKSIEWGTVSVKILSVSNNTSRVLREQSDTKPSRLHATTSRNPRRWASKSVGDMAAVVAGAFNVISFLWWTVDGDSNRSSHSLYTAASPNYGRREGKWKQETRGSMSW